MKLLAALALAPLGVMLCSQALAAQAIDHASGPRLQAVGISQRAQIPMRAHDDTAARSVPFPTGAAIRVVADTDSAATHIGNRRLHMVIGGAIGAAIGWMAGRSADGGRAGCGSNGQSGQTCDWTSGYEEPAGALLGMLLGVGIGALWPHD